MIRNLGGTWTMAFLSWEKTEPTDGNFAWSALDGALQGCQVPGLSIFGVLADAPSWAAKVPSGEEIEKATDVAQLRPQPRPDFPAQYARALTAAAQRYAPVIPVWGALDVDRYAPDAVGQVLRASRAALEQALPVARLVGEVRSPAPGQAAGPPPGAAEVAEICYPDLDAPLSWDVDRDRARLEAYRGSLGQAAAKPLWVRNWLRSGEKAGPGEPPAPPAEAPPCGLTPALDSPGARGPMLGDAGDLARLLLAERALGVEHIGWALLRDYGSERAGLLTADGSPQPAACAFATVCDLLAGSRFLRDDSDAAARRLVFSTPDGRQVVAAWKRGDAPASVAVADPAATEVVSLLGAHRPAGATHDAGTVALGENPVYLVTGAAR